MGVIPRSAGFRRHIVFHSKAKRVLSLPSLACDSTRPSASQQSVG